MSLQSEASRRESSVHEACRRAEDLLAQDAPMFESLAVLVAAAEATGGAGVVSSILLIEHDGLLRNGSFLGTFGTYFRECREPTSAEQRAVAACGQVDRQRHNRSTLEQIRSVVDAES